MALHKVTESLNPAKAGGCSDPRGRPPRDPKQPRNLRTAGRRDEPVRRWETGGSGVAPHGPRRRVAGPGQLIHRGPTQSQRDRRNDERAGVAMALAVHTPEHRGARLSSRVLPRESTKDNGRQVIETDKRHVN